MINRRNAYAFALLLSVCLPNTNLLAQEIEANRPNILLILADDWGWLGADAVDPLNLDMPNLEMIAREGVNFTNAYVASPSCTTSRGALLSGQWPWRLKEGAVLQGSLPKDIPIYTELLEDSGYHIGYTRKGWAPGSLEPAGRTRNPAGDSYEDFDAFLEDRPDDAPFAFWFGTTDPHRPYDKGLGVRSGIDPNDIEVPPYLPDTAEVRSDIVDYRFELERLDREVGELIRRLADDGELDNTIVVMTGDNGMPFPRAKATLYHAGWHVPLVIMWKGRIVGNQTSHALVSLIDLPATFLEAAGVNLPEQMNGRSLSTVLRNPDAPHRRHVLGATERHMDGRTVAGQGYPARAIRTDKYLYIHNFRPDRWPAGDPERRPVDETIIESDIWAAYADIDTGPTKAVVVVSSERNYFLELATGKRPSHELYDVENDPYDMTNLAFDPEYADIVSDLERVLQDNLRATGDPRVLQPLEDVFDRYPSHPDPGFGRPENWEER